MELRKIGSKIKRKIKKTFEETQKKPENKKTVSVERYNCPELNDRGYEVLLTKKANMAAKYADLLGREMFAFYDESDREAFAGFVKRHPVFIYRPAEYCKEVERKLIDTADTTGADDLFDVLIAIGSGVAEEPVEAECEALGVTFINGEGETEILYLKSDVSGLPSRAEAETLLKKAAAVAPKLRLVEWEIAYSDGKWLLMDGTAHPRKMPGFEVPAADAAADPSAAEPAEAGSDVQKRADSRRDAKPAVVSFTGDFAFSARLQGKYLDNPVDQRLLDFLNDGDAAIIDFESTITSYRDTRFWKTGVSRRLCHRSDPESLGYIKTAFKSPVLSFANNHMYDMSDTGFVDTLANTEEYDVRYIGFGKNRKDAFRYEIFGDDVKAGVFAVMYKRFKGTLNKPFLGPGYETMIDEIRETIEELRPKVDYVVMVYHGGKEFMDLPDPEKRELLRGFLDMGCDVIVSHHPHVVQGYEYIDGKPVFYSLGNFLFDTDYQRTQKGTDEGVLLKLKFAHDGVSYDTMPVHIDRENSRVVPGELSENFFDISTIDYDGMWKKEEEKYAALEAERKVIKDDMMGWIYFRDSMQMERALEAVKQLNSLSDYKDIEKALLTKKGYIEEAKEESGVGTKPDSYYLAHRISLESGRTAEEIQKNIENVCSHTGIGPAEYYRWELQNYSEVRALREARKRIRGQKRRKHLAKVIGKAYGMKPAQVLADCNAKGVSLNDDFRYGFSRFEGDGLTAALDKVSRIKELAASIKAATYASTEIPEKTKADIGEIYDLTREMLSDERRAEIMRKAGLKDDDADAAETAVDMQLMHQIWGYKPEEYMMFAFRDKPLEERLTFVSSSLKNDFISAVNPADACDVLNDKYLTYRRIPELYGRKVVLYDGSNMNELLEFAAERDAFVKKSLYDAMGRGVSLVKLPDDPEAKKAEVMKTAGEEYAEGGAFMAEELIASHDALRKLNSTSVNTVRICTYNDGGKVKVHDSFAKIGREGAFVDNGGAGGIFVHIDIKTGVMDSDGIDEGCNRYAQHPDNGTVFRGYAYPEWDKAVETAVKAAEEISELAYIGWDLTYTEDCRWIIVEGNARTQFLGQQSTTGVGTLEAFAGVLGGFDKLRSYYTAEQEA